MAEVYPQHHQLGSQPGSNAFLWYLQCRSRKRESAACFRIRVGILANWGLKIHTWGYLLNFRMGMPKVEKQATSLPNEAKWNNHDMSFFFAFLGISEILHHRISYTFANPCFMLCESGKNYLCSGPLLHSVPLNLQYTVQYGRNLEKLFFRTRLKTLFWREPRAVLFTVSHF